MTRPEREIRAFYDERTIRVYQAYSHQIADSALKDQTFVSPPFSMTRMTWIKPSFLWMMYRAGWGEKDDGQRRILAIDITHDGFAWALAHSAPSHPETGQSHDEWKAAMERSPVRVQWDPERDLHHNPLPHRAIQIGLSGEAVNRYVSEWIVRISEVTDEARYIHDLVRKGVANEPIRSFLYEEAQRSLPREKPYTLEVTPAQFLAVEREQLLLTTHCDHEAIVRLLQDNPDDASVPYLRQAIALKPSLTYLDYDDYGAFYKRCLWALQEIATPEALAAIEECASSEIEQLRDEARYRLQRIAEAGGAPLMRKR